MSTFTEKPGTGALFENKGQSDNAPSVKGTITTPDGKRWSLSGWRKTTSKGEEMLSLKLTEYVAKT